MRVGEVVEDEVRDFGKFFKYNKIIEKMKKIKNIKFIRIKLSLSFDSFIIFVV